MIQVATEEEVRMGGYRWDGKCVLLIDNKCSVYENRAFICRLFGSSESMKCPDCTPERYLSESDTAELIRKYVRLK
jgi:Fe-S-cluster containining protein